MSDSLLTKASETTPSQSQNGLAFTPMEWLGVSLLMLFSLVLRLRPYLDQRAMWLDELFLIENLRNRDLMGLLEPLSEGQVTTPGFMIITELLVMLLGQGEWVYRLVPMITAVLIPVLAWLIFRSGLGRLAGMVAMGLSALNPYLIFYGAEFKPYGLDVICALMMAGLAYLVAKDFHWKWMLCFAAVGLFSLIFSLTAVFGIASAGLIIGGLLIWKKRWLGLVNWSGLILLLAAFFLVQYLLVISAYQSEDHVWKYWVAQKGFPGGTPWSFLSGPLELENWSWWLWWPRVVNEWMKCPVGIITTWGSPLPIAKGVLLSWFLLPIWFFGLWCLWKRSKLWFALGMGPVVLVLAGAVAYKYPAVDRVVLFLLPGLILPFACVIAWAWEKVLAWRDHRESLGTVTRPNLWRLLLTLVIVFIMQGIYLPVTAVRFFEPRSIPQSEELRDLMVTLKEVREPGEKIFVFWWAQYAWRHYADKVGLPGDGHADVIQLVCANEHFERIVWHLELEAPRDRRFWVVFTHANTYWPENERRYVEEAIHKIGGITLHTDSIRDISDSGHHQTAILALDFTNVPIPNDEEKDILRGKIWPDPDPKDKGLERSLREEEASLED